MTFSDFLREHGISVLALTVAISALILALLPRNKPMAMRSTTLDVEQSNEGGGGGDS